MAVRDSQAPAIHNISFFGLAGFIFACFTLAVVLYLQAFITTAWIVSDLAVLHNASSHSVYTGPWLTAHYSEAIHANKAWFISFQVLLTLGLFLLLICFILSVIYMSANKISKNLTLTSLLFISMINFLIALTALILMGVMLDRDESITWSYIIACISVFFILVGFFLTLHQIRKSNVRVC